MKRMRVLTLAIQRQNKRLDQEALKGKPKTGTTVTLEEVSNELLDQVRVYEEAQEVGGMSRARASHIIECLLAANRLVVEKLRTK